MARRRKKSYSRKKMINIPLVSTASGLAIFTAMNGGKAVGEAMQGQIGTALNTVANSLTSPESKAKIAGTVGGTVLAKLLLKSLPRNVGKLGPVVFTTG